MSIISGLMSLGKKASTTNFIKRGAVETQKVLQGKVNVGGWKVDGLLRSPQADAFISSAAKQKANIVSDNIVRFSDGTIPYRVITKRLPSGTTIAQAYDVRGGEKAFKEVISKTGVAYSAGTGRKNVALVHDYAKGVGYYKPRYTEAKDVHILPHNAHVANLFLENSKGLTELSNANNANYQNLKKMGMIY